MHSETKHPPFTAESTTRLSEILNSARKDVSFPAPSNQIAPKSYPELYSKVFYRLNQLTRDKALLEESLRSEMMTSEEQKAYIEVLKQALEARMEDLGIKDSLNLETFEALSTLKSDSDFSKREVLKLRQDLKNSQEMVVKLRGTVDELMRQAEGLKKERGSAVKEREKAIRAVEEAEFTLRSLEDEKNALLDYVEETGLQELKIQLSALQEEREELLQTSAETEAKNTELEDIVAHQETDIEDLRRTLEDLMHQTSRLPEVEGQLEQTNAQCMELRQQHDGEKTLRTVTELALEGLRSQVKEQSEHIKHLAGETKRLEQAEIQSQASIEAASLKLEETLEAYKALQQQSEEQGRELAEVKKSYADVETSRSDNEAQLVLALDQLADKNKQLDALQKSIEGFREALSAEKKESSSLFDEILKSRTKIKDLTERLNHKVQEVEQLTSRCDEAKEQLMNSQLTASQSAEQTIKAYNERLASVTSAHSSLLQENFSLRREIAEMKGKVAEAEDLGNTVEELNETLKVMAGDKVRLIERLSELEEVGHFTKECNQLVKLLHERPLPPKTAALLGRWRSRSIRGQEYIEWMRLLSDEVVESEDTLRHCKESVESLKSELNQVNGRSSERERILKQELKAVEKERDFLASTKEGYYKRLESANSEVACLKTQLNALKMELDSLLTLRPRASDDTGRHQVMALEEKVRRCQTSRGNMERTSGGERQGGSDEAGSINWR
jgi:chromosome segregation ATPase